MDRIAVANKLVSLAKTLVAGENEDNKTSGLKKRIEVFIKDNKEALKDDEYEYARIKLFGPKGDTKFMNVSIADLEAMAKVLK